MHGNIYMYIYIYIQGRWKLSQPGQANGSHVPNDIKRTTAKLIQLVTIEKVLSASAIVLIE